MNGWNNGREQGGNGDGGAWVEAKATAHSILLNCLLFYMFGTSLHTPWRHLAKVKKIAYSLGLFDHNYLMTHRPFLNCQNKMTYFCMVPTHLVSNVHGYSFIKYVIFTHWYTHTQDEEFWCPEWIKCMFVDIYRYIHTQPTWLKHVRCM